MMMQQAAKFRSRNGRKLTTGLGWRSSQKISADQAHGEQDRQRLHTPERVAQPVPFLALAERHLPTDDDDDQQRQANAVKAERPLPQLHALCREVIGVPECDGTRAQGQEADGDVDPEHPPPGVAVGYPAAERRTDDGRDQRGQAEQRHGHALPLDREGVQQHALAGRLKTTAGKTLEHAEQDQLPEPRGHAAQPRGEGEYGDGKQEIVAAPKMRDQPAGDGQDDRVGGKVAGDDPFAVIDRGRQPARDIAQRHDRDRGVEHLHEGRHHDDSGDDPGVYRRAGWGIQGCRRRDRAAHCQRLTSGCPTRWRSDQGSETARSVCGT